MKPLVTRTQKPTRLTKPPGHNPADLTKEPQNEQGLNNALSNWAHRSLSSAPRVQAKLEIGEPGDRFEQEADEFAEVATEGIALAPPIAFSLTNDGVEPGAQEFLVPETLPEEIETASSQSAFGHEAPPNFFDDLGDHFGKGTTLNLHLRTHFQGLLGHDLDSVRIHTDAEAATLSRQIQARAFTLGQDIFFGQGQYNPASPQGRQLIAHEVAHTVQQGNTEVIRRKGPDEPPKKDSPEPAIVLSPEPSFSTEELADAIDQNEKIWEEEMSFIDPYRAWKIGHDSDKVAYALLTFKLQLVMAAAQRERDRINALAGLPPEPRAFLVVPDGVMTSRLFFLIAKNLPWNPVYESNLKAILGANVDLYLAWLSDLRLRFGPRSSGNSTELLSQFGELDLFNLMMQRGGIVLKKGDRGLPVFFLQLALSRVGYPIQSSEAVGIYGTGTIQAVTNFQTDQGFMAADCDGKFGQKTLTALDLALAQLPSQPTASGDYLKFYVPIPAVPAGTPLKKISTLVVMHIFKLPKARAEEVATMLEERDDLWVFRLAGDVQTVLPHEEVLGIVEFHISRLLYESIAGRLGKIELYEPNPGEASIDLVIDQLQVLEDLIWIYLVYWDDYKDKPISEYPEIVKNALADHQMSSLLEFHALAQTFLKYFKDAAFLHLQELLEVSHREIKYEKWHFEKEKEVQGLKTSLEQYRPMFETIDGMYAGIEQQFLDEVAQTLGLSLTPEHVLTEKARYRDRRKSAKPRFARTYRQRIFSATEAITDSKSRKAKREQADVLLEKFGAKLPSLGKLEEAFDQNILAKLGARYPVLYLPKFKKAYKEIATEMSVADLRSLLTEEIDQALEANEDLLAKYHHVLGRSFLKKRIWELRPLAIYTMAKFGIEPNSTCGILIMKELKDHEPSGWTIFWNVVLSIGLAVLGTLSGGTISALAWGTLLVWDSMDVLKGVIDHDFESDAYNAWFDKDKAIVQEEPGWGWIILSAISMGFDIFELNRLAKGIKAAERAVKAAAAGKDLGTTLGKDQWEAISKLLPELLEKAKQLGLNPEAVKKAWERLGKRFAGRVSDRTLAQMVKIVLDNPAALKTFELVDDFLTKILVAGKRVKPSQLDEALPEIFRVGRDLRTRVLGHLTTRGGDDLAEIPKILTQIQKLGIKDLDLITHLLTTRSANAALQQGKRMEEIVALWERYQKESKELLAVGKAAPRFSEYLAQELGITLTRQKTVAQVTRHIANAGNLTKALVVLKEVEPHFHQRLFDLLNKGKSGRLLPKEMMAAIRTTLDEAIPDSAMIVRQFASELNERLATAIVKAAGSQDEIKRVVVLLDHLQLTELVYLKYLKKVMATAQGLSPKWLDEGVQFNLAQILKNRKIHNYEQLLRIVQRVDRAGVANAADWMHEFSKFASRIHEIPAQLRRSILIGLEAESDDVFRLYNDIAQGLGKRIGSPKWRAAIEQAYQRFGEQQLLLLHKGTTDFAAWIRDVDVLKFKLDPFIDSADLNELLQAARRLAPETAHSNGTRELAEVASLLPDHSFAAAFLQKMEAFTAATKQLPAAMQDPVSGYNAIREMIFDADTLERLAKLPKSFYAEVIGNAGDGFKDRRIGKILASLIDDAGEIDFAKWAVLRKVIQDLDKISLVTKNQIIGELWSRLQAQRLQKSIPQGIREIRVRIKSSGLEARVDFGGPQADQLLFFEMKSGKGVYSNEQAAVYKLMDEGKWDELEFLNPMVRRWMEQNPNSTRLVRMQEPAFVKTHADQLQIPATPLEKVRGPKASPHPNPPGKDARKGAMPKTNAADLGDIPGQPLRFATDPATISQGMAAGLPIGKTFADAQTGFDILHRLQQGDRKALVSLGVDELPPGFDPAKVEWGLAKMRDSEQYFIVGPNHGRSMEIDWNKIDEFAEPLAHTHPYIDPLHGARSLKTVEGSRQLQDILLDNDNLTLLLPSAADLHFFFHSGFTGTKHRVLTPYYYHLDTKEILNQAAGPRSRRIDIEFAMPKAHGTLPDFQASPVWQARASFLVDGKPIAIEGNQVMELDLYAALIQTERGVQSYMGLTPPPGMKGIFE